MALGNVFMRDTDGNIDKGTAGFNDGVCGLIFDISKQSGIWETTAGATMKNIWKDKIIKIESKEDIDNREAGEDLGLRPYDAEAEDNFLNGVPYYHISQFFKQRQKTNEKAELYVMFADCTSGWSAIVDMQKAADGEISQFGVWTEQNLWSKNQLDGPYTLNLVSDLQVVGETLANEYHAPASILLSANTSKIYDPEKPLDQVVLKSIPTCDVKARYVSVLLSQESTALVRAMQAAFATTTPVGVIGAALGVLSVANVGESLGWVAKFMVTNEAVEFGFGNSTLGENQIVNATQYEALKNKELDALDDKRYIFLRAFTGLGTNKYFNFDATCSTDDFCTISRNRAINKSRRLVRTVLLPYVNSPVKVDPATGFLSAAQTTVYSNLVTSVLQAMAGAEEISAIGSVVVPMNQNILATNKIQLSYSIIPLGTAKEIRVEEGLAMRQNTNA